MSELADLIERVEQRIESARAELRRTPKPATARNRELQITTALDELNAACVEIERARMVGTVPR